MSRNIKVPRRFKSSAELTRAHSSSISSGLSRFFSSHDKTFHQIQQRNGTENHYHNRSHLHHRSKSLGSEMLRKRKAISTTIKGQSRIKGPRNGDEERGSASRYTSSGLGRRLESTPTSLSLSFLNRKCDAFQQQNKMRLRKLKKKISQHKKTNIILATAFLEHLQALKLMIPNQKKKKGQTMIRRRRTYVTKVNNQRRKIRNGQGQVEGQVDSVGLLGTRSRRRPGSSACAHLLQQQGALQAIHRTEPIQEYSINSSSQPLNTSFKLGENFQSNSNSKSNPQLNSRGKRKKVGVTTRSIKDPTPNQNTNLLVQRQNRNKSENPKQKCLYCKKLLAKTYLCTHVRHYCKSAP